MAAAASAMGRYIIVRHTPTSSRNSGAACDALTETCHLYSFGRGARGPFGDLYFFGISFAREGAGKSTKCASMR